MTNLVGAIVAVAAGGLGWQVLGMVARRLERRHHRLASAVLQVLARALLLYGIATGIAVALPILAGSVLTPAWQERVIIVLMTLVTAVVVARLLRQLLRLGIKAERAEPLAASLMQGIIYAAVYIIAAVVILAALGVNISAMVAAIGASGLIIGLALQETLTNFFAGFYILLTGKIKVGDFVQFETFEGTVEDITWRTTIIRRANNALLIVPNQRMSTSVLSVFRAEQTPVMVRLELLVEPSAELARAQQAVHAALAALVASGSVAGLCAEPPPVVRFGDSSREGVPMIVWVPAVSVQHMFEVRSAAMQACINALTAEAIPLVVLRR